MNLLFGQFGGSRCGLRPIFVQNFASPRFICSTNELLMHYCSVLGKDTTGKTNCPWGVSGRHLNRESVNSDSRFTIKCM